MRCKACDARLEPYEIVWRRDLHKYEDLCNFCRRESKSDNPTGRIPEDDVEGATDNEE